MNLYKNSVKPLFDWISAFLGILFLVPVFVLVTLFLYVANDGKPFFFQARPGKNGKIFKIIKFKTMNDQTDSQGELLPDALRLTKIGAFVRKTSLDEIPQLINVLKGDMSIIGPRPLLTSYLHLYNDFQNRRHEVKPGITGLAQIKGRNEIDWETKFKYDVFYVDNISLFLDLKIILLTIDRVLRSKGINTKEGQPIEPFDGK